MRTLLLSLALVILAGCSVSAGESSEHLTEKAMASISAASDEAELNSALRLLEEAIELDSGYLPARKQKTQVLVRLGQLVPAVEEAKQVAVLSGSPQDHFFLCMVQEASNPHSEEHQACYLESSRRYESSFASPATDINYVLALKLADSDQFEKAANQFLDSLTVDASRELFEPLLFESTRDGIIDDLFFSF